MIDWLFPTHLLMLSHFYLYLSFNRHVISERWLHCDSYQAAGALVIVRLTDLLNRLPARASMEFLAFDTWHTQLPGSCWVAEWFLAIVKTGDRQFMTEKPRPIAVNPELSRGEFCRFPLVLPVLFFPQKLPLPALPCLAPPANQQTIWNLGKKTHWSTISGWFRNDGSLEWLIKDLPPSDIENISLKFAILAILPQILVYGKICISSPLCLGDLLLQSITSAHTNCFGAFLWYVSGIHHFVLFQIMITGNNISLQ